MEKKLKINFILKGIAVFAFVAFCLLAILAGVTLPFVSNASTDDGTVVNVASDLQYNAVASANNTINYDNFTITLSNCNTTDTYYGFYITEDLYNFVKTYSYDSSQSYIIAQLSNNTILMCGTASFDDFGTTRNFNYCCLTPDFQYFNSFFTTIESYSCYSNYFLFNNGFTFSMINTELPQTFLPIRDKIKVFTSLPYEEKETIVTNIGFQSRFGFVGSMPSSNLYLNLQEKPVLPDSLRTIKDTNGNLVNGWSYADNQYYLPVVNAYDGFGNPVDGGFTGWQVTHVGLAGGGVHPTKMQIWFVFSNITVFGGIEVDLVDGVLSVPDYTNYNYLVQSNFPNDDNLLVYADLNKSYKYYLQPNISQNDIFKFFALIDYRNYSPADNDFYVAGFNSASKGYYDNGYKNGYSAGNTDGYKTGYTAGDSKGYQRGLSDSNNYSFLSLFGAIFDAPIQALFGGTHRLPAGTKITDSSGNTITLTSDTIVNRGGMLNFDLMGVNLSGFVLALFSLSIIIIVIKFALAKK